MILAKLIASESISQQLIEENFESGFGSYWSDNSAINSAYWSHPQSGILPIGPRPPQTNGNNVTNNDFIEVVPIDSTSRTGMASLRSQSTNFTPGAHLELTYWAAYPPGAGRSVALVVYTWADPTSKNKTLVFTAGIDPAGSPNTWISHTIDLRVTAFSTFQVFVRECHKIAQV